MKQLGIIFIFNILLISMVLADVNDDEMTSTEVNQCLQKAYKFTDVDKDNRLLDINKITGASAMCSCGSNIWSYFKEQAKKITKRVNPATDAFTKALRAQMEASDLKIKELVNLKYANSLYSFYDKDGEKQKIEELKMEEYGDGCIDTFTFREPETNRKKIYREGLLKQMLLTLHEWKKSKEMSIDKNTIEMVK